MGHASGIWDRESSLLVQQEAAMSEAEVAREAEAWREHCGLAAYRIPWVPPEECRFPDQCDGRDGDGHWHPADWNGYWVHQLSRPQRLELMQLARERGGASLTAIALEAGPLSPAPAVEVEGSPMRSGPGVLQLGADSVIERAVRWQMDERQRPVERPNRYDVREYRLEERLDRLRTAVLERWPDIEKSRAVDELAVRVALEMAEEEIGRPMGSDLSGELPGGWRLGARREVRRARAVQGRGRWSVSRVVAELGRRAETRALLGRGRR